MLADELAERSEPCPTTARVICPGPSRGPGTRPEPDEPDDAEPGPDDEEVAMSSTPPPPAPVAWSGCPSSSQNGPSSCAAVRAGSARPPCRPPSPSRPPDRGRRACVVTIDPAKRLADALGVETLGNSARRIEGDWPGELWALMLDPKGTFDDLIGRYASSTEQAEGILANRIYRNLTGALSGTQEYMAMEKLYELSEAGLYDLVVVDTPPLAQRPGLPRRPPPSHPIPRPPAVPAAAHAHEGLPAGRLGCHPGPAADHLEGCGGGDRARRRGVLPGLRRDGGRVPDPGRATCANSSPVGRRRSSS